MVHLAMADCHVGVVGNVELVVIRNCCGSRPDILEYVNEVISEAVNDCKGVRVSCTCYPLLYYLTHLLSSLTMGVNSFSMAGMLGPAMHVFLAW